MNKAIIIIGLLLATCFYADAQISYGAKISGGLAYQKVTNADVLSTGSVRTFNIRGIAQMPLKDDFWVEGGLGYSGKGSIVYLDGLTTTTHLSYLEVPLSVVKKLKFTDLGLFYIGAGGYLAYGLGGSLDFETPGSSTSDKVSFGKNNDARTVDTGVIFSTGFEFRNKLTFNVAYTLGLNNIASGTQQDTGTSVVKNREFSVGLGYRIK